MTQTYLPTLLGTQSLQIMSSAFGWFYFVIWSLSFYPQIITLLRNKSGLGMSSNYIPINATGYLFYLVYNTYGYYKGNNKQTGNVVTTDFLFSVHSVLCYGICVSLYFYYPHKFVLSIFTKTYVSLQWAVFFFFGGMHLYYENEQNPYFIVFPLLGFNIGFFTLLGYFKMIATLLKHPPQLYHNFKRKSTKGWAIEAMLMDFAGGFFSFSQLFIQLQLNPLLHTNIAKLFLSTISMVYDICYVIQHYILYREIEQKPSSTVKNTSKGMSLKGGEEEKEAMIPKEKADPQETQQAMTKQELRITMTSSESDKQSTTGSTEIDSNSSKLPKVEASA